MTFSTADYPTKGDMLKHVDTLLWKVNSNTPQNISKELSFNGVCNKFIQDEHLREISRLKPGQQNTYGTLKVSTCRGYLQLIANWLRPKWGEMPMSAVTASLVHEWLKVVPRSATTRGHIKALLHRLFERAMLWQIIPSQRNPMELVEIKGSSRRSKRPNVLTREQILLLLNIFREPFKTMVLVAICLGLRASEILSLKWVDIDFENLTLRVERAVVKGVIDSCKTECSEAELPLDRAFAEALLEYRKIAAPSADGWLFASPRTGRPYANIQRVFREAGVKLGIPHLGFHDLRHTHRSMLDACGAPVGVQQQLMRHAQVSTTMNHYGSAMMEAKRQANSAAVKMVFLGVAPTSGELQNAS
ncbi:MAG: site-specific integrase [Candidatus Korobacteraceae bacterium]|jgi:integrase